MKNKRAFTLIEVIGVIATLGLILLVAVPSMTKTLKRNEQKKYDNYITNLKLVSENYLVDQLQKGKVKFDEYNNVAYFSLGDVIDAGYVKDVITNPNNGKKLSRNTTIKSIRNIDSTYSFEIIYSNMDDYILKDNNNNNNITKPIFHLDSIAKEEGYIKVDNSYVDDDIYESFKNDLRIYQNGSQNLFYYFFYAMKNVNFTNTSISFNFNVNINNIFVFNFHNEDYDSYNDLFINNKKNKQGPQTIAIKNETNKNVLNDSLIDNKSNTITLVFNDDKSIDVYINGTQKGNYKNMLIDDHEKNIVILSCTYDKEINTKNIIGLNNFIVYNKALSAQEIEALYNLDKERFGE